MEIIKFAGKNCVKCRVLDQVFNHVTLPCDVNVRYVEDESTEQFYLEGVTSLPTLMFKNATDTIKLEGTITPKQIKEAIEKMQQ
jgi:hypothetical protein